MTYILYYIAEIRSYKNVVDIDALRVFIDVDDFREHLLPSDYLVTVHLNL